MKKTTKLLMSLVVVGATAGCLLTGCEKKDNNKDNNNTNASQTVKTPANKLAELFEKEVKETKDLKKLGEALKDSEIIEYNVDVMELKKGDYFPGFDNEIKNYKKLVAVNPMIGAQPFALYLFETDKPEELEKELKENHNLRWNICTSADEMVTRVEGNIVFFVMSPKSFEEEE